VSSQARAEPAALTIGSRVGHAQEERELRPVLEHVGDRCAEAGVRLDAMLVELLVRPRLELGHPRPAVRLVQAQALVGLQRAVARERVSAIDLAQRLEHVADLGGEVLDDVDEATTRVGDAAGEERVEVARGVGSERVAHVDR
jgi:hypothetical protein